jgi:hypothetical protein
MRRSFLRRLAVTPKVGRNQPVVHELRVPPPTTSTVAPTLVQRVDLEAGPPPRTTAANFNASAS